jgi:hypothetical protein
LAKNHLVLQVGGWCSGPAPRSSLKQKKVLKNHTPSCSATQKKTADLYGTLSFSTVFTKAPVINFSFNFIRCFQPSFVKTAELLVTSIGGVFLFLLNLIYLLLLVFLFPDPFLLFIFFFFFSSSSSFCCFFVVLSQM